jgi:hypothetical protein
MEYIVALCQLCSGLRGLAAEENPFFLPLTILLQLSIRIANKKRFL